MTVSSERFQLAAADYALLGVDVEAALNALAGIPISIHCWQGDDVIGFDGAGAVSGGIQATGNYPGRARNFTQLKQDIETALHLLPGKHRLNLHASYAVFEPGPKVDRDQLNPEHFQPWIDFAKENGLGLDFNPTLFGHPLAEAATLSSEDEAIRQFWIRHCQACIKIAEAFADQLEDTSLVNIWIPDGLKDIPADRTSPRARLKASLDQILTLDYDRSKVKIAVESKVFGIGIESYTVGSHEFYMNYAARNQLLCLLDSGHYHPTEMISDKISSMLLFSDELALHISRPVRWDSDHVVLYDDETRQIAQEIIRSDVRRVRIATDYFDASINRIAAWVIGVRSVQKALLNALLTPQATLAELQRQRRFTELMALQEQLKMASLGAVWDVFCQRQGVPGESEWLKEVQDYECRVLVKREKEEQA